MKALPANEFIIKLASRCNLNCDYCYEYNLGDASWRTQPAFMSLETASKVADRIAHHALTHSLPHITIAFHGGEPMLAGPERIASVAKIFRQRLGPITSLHISMQSNATLVNDDILGVLEKYEIAVGVSIDGPREANDLHRKDHYGNSSFEATVSGIGALKRRGLLHGLLSVIDVRNDPLLCFDFIASFGVEQIDFILPHHNWVRPPFRPESYSSPAYGEWLATIWRAWIGGRHPHAKIRYLEHIIRLLVGAPGLFEGLGLEPVQLLVLAADGSIEGVDTLKSCGDGQQRMELSIIDSPIDSVLSHDQYLHRQLGHLSLSPKCQECPELEVCGGGYLPHRYKGCSSFVAPSVYCDDILYLIRTIRNDILVRANKNKVLG